MHLPLEKCLSICWFCFSNGYSGNVLFYTMKEQPYRFSHEICEEILSQGNCMERVHSFISSWELQERHQHINPLMVVLSQLVMVTMEVPVQRILSAPFEKYGTSKTNRTGNIWKGRWASLISKKSYLCGDIVSQSQCYDILVDRILQCKRPRLINITPATSSGLENLMEFKALTWFHVENSMENPFN